MSAPADPALRHARVAVPASSANLGPGYDALAVALDVRLEARTTPRGEQRVVTTGAGAGELPSGDDNLVWRTLVGFCERAGANVPDVSVQVDNPIPLERGLGSSAAAAVAGLALGRALTGAPASAHDLIALASELEGHADNAAAAVLGGLTLCRPGGAARLEPSEGLRPVVCVPQVRQSTEAARGLLPGSVPLADAAANGGRVAAVLAGLVGMLPLDVEAMTDVLHEPARFGAMPASGQLVAALRGDGIPACLSGAGPSVLAVVAAGSRAAVQRVAALAGAAWRVWPTAWDRSGVTACVGTPAL